LLKTIFSFLFKQLVRKEYKNVAYLPRVFPYYLDITTAFPNNPFLHFIGRLRLNKLCSTFCSFEWRQLATSATRRADVATWYTT